MEFTELKDFHYITHVCNVASIMQHGLLSHNKARTVPHESIAMPQIQEKRARKVLPNARPLHDYVNLYFHARNPMLYKLREQHAILCVLRVSPLVLLLPDVLITDGNAASQYTAFYPALEGLKYLNAEEVYAEWWMHQDRVKEYRKKRLRCAEILVPDRIG